MQILYLTFLASWQVLRDCVLQGARPKAAYIAALGRRRGHKKLFVTAPFSCKIVFSAALIIILFTAF